MKDRLKKGWDMTLRHKYVLVLLFLYRLLWGFFLYRFVDTIVTPILARYPGDHPNADAARLFLVEAQFRILKTDLLNETLLWLGGLLLARMILTPLLNAGVYYSFHRSEDGAGTHVWSGIRLAWKPVTALYWLENALAALPALWLIPLARDRFYSESSLADWLQGLFPYAGLWLVWGFLLHLLFQFMQFGAVSKEGVVNGIGQAVRKGAPLLAVTLAMLGIGIAVSLAASAVALLWSGFLAVALHQAFHFVRSLLTLWTSASQYYVWRET
ncbi:hypothetical protein [Cohnella panacarvi]|uniref:hypothetical protein n=1 Tax=Cohnella panacarvi TaxID=400776 RepID=UPI00047E9F54|nr:hypothetical protein [Cohnella panacarvi]